jgi:hypothetical protein
MGRSVKVGHDKLLTSLFCFAPLLGTTCSAGKGLRRHYRANATKLPCARSATERTVTSLSSVCQCRKKALTRQCENRAAEFWQTY